MTNLPTETSTDRPTETPQQQQKIEALRRMKMVATGAFLLMTALFILSIPFENESLLFFIRWDHLNAFAEAAMIGALADWFAVVALFRHPLGIPIWHTAIIPRKKDEIGRNLARFVETRLLSVENLSSEIDRLSIANAATSWTRSPENRSKLEEWIADGLRTLIRGFDDQEMNRMIGEVITRRLSGLDAAALLSGGMKLMVEGGRHEALIDAGLERIAAWLPSRRDVIREFVRSAVTRTLKWGSALVPEVMIERATDRTLEALIAVLLEAAADPSHPMREDLSNRVVDWIDRLQSDPEWHAKIEEWKEDLINSASVRDMISRLWDEGKEKLLRDLETPGSPTHAFIGRGLDRFAARLSSDPELRTSIDARLRGVVTTFLARHHGEIGALVERIIGSWDGQRLAREMELNLGRDLQYIRLNGTFIGGMVGLIIHLLR